MPGVIPKARLVRVADNQVLCKYLELLVVWPVDFFRACPPTIVLAPEKVPENDGTYGLSETPFS